MLVLFRHDDFAQVIIHTANMISRDWGNMTQAVWRSPLLPLLASSPALSSSGDPSDTATRLIGSGERFKVDLIRYFKAYGNRVKSLATQLAQYDFSAIHAAFISSAPSRQKPVAAQPSKQTSFGWLGLQEILSAVPIITKNAGSPSHIVMQVSSIATLGAAPTWLTNFQAVLSRSLDAVPTSTTVSSTSVSKASSFFSKNTAKAVTTRKPKYNIIFPTPDEIRTSLDGYAAGGSIHIKLQSAQQQKQQEYLHPLFCHWKSSATPSLAFRTEARGGEALRGPAAPHIKTYVRFSDERHDKIDWAMVTSANLSKQAWGDVVNKKDEIWIQSWEAGVVVWPALSADSEAGQEEAVMVPVFGRDTPETEDVCDTERVGRDADGYTEQEKEKPQMVVGFRMPYDLPLSPYAADEKPWCATMQYPEPDWKGLAWGGY
jgi:tyrosyl-DNA phosphodiesterase-1